jgi:hypothetical protein
MKVSAPIPLDEPRTFGQVIDASVRCYMRAPLLLFGLALAVVCPYDLLVLAIAHVPPLGNASTSASTALVLNLLRLAVVAPFVSALLVRAVAALGDGRRASLKDVGWRGLQALPIVVAAQLVAAIAIGLGVLVFIIPGIYLAVRLEVVAQAATIERTDWIGALRRSMQLTRGSGWHVFAVALASGLFNELLVSTTALAIGSSHQPLQVAAGVVIDTLAQSVLALVSAILYFDLRARERMRAAP